MAHLMAHLEVSLMARRSHGTGSVYYDEPRDRWVGSVELGWTAKGTRRRKRVVARTEREAKVKIRNLLRTAEASEAAIVGGKPTVRTWAEQWLDITQDTLRPTSWANNRSAVRRWIIPTIGHRRLDTLTPGDVRAVTRAILAAGSRESTAQRHYAVLMTMLRAAALEGHRVPQHVLLVEGVGAGETDRNAIPLADALDILAVASQRPDASRWVAAFLQAMRPAEALGLTWAHVHFDTHEIDLSWQLKALPYKVLRDRDSGFRVPRGYTARRLSGALHLVRPKTASGLRVIPMVPWMESALLAWQEVAPASPHSLVWPRPDGRPQPDVADRQEWVSICDTAQVASVDGDGQGRRYALYEARHTAATLLRESGVDEETIIAIMGHSSVLSTRAYLHTSTARTRAALEQVAARLGLTQQDGDGRALPAAG